MRTTAFALVSGLLMVSCSSRAVPTDDFRPTVILISIDGFRADYMDLYDTPNLTRLAKSGVYADQGILPVFPTKTFPNHYAIATGLYPAHNGMVANTIYDVTSDRWFRISDRDAVEDPFWWGGEPIWVTAEKQGQISATYFWVGSEAPVQGVRPTYWFRHDASVPGKDRVDQVLDWLDLPAKKRPTVITLYFSDVDSQGHRYGPRSRQVEQAVERTDALMGRLVDGLRSRELDTKVHIVVTSDHGMAEVDPSRQVYLEDYLDRDDGLVVTYSPVLAIRPKPGRENRIRRALADIPGLRLLDQKEMERYHYTGNPRIPEVIALAQVGWTISSSRDFVEQSGPPTPGTHGYDPDSESMRALFIAAGPGIRKGVTVSPFENIHIYNLLARLADLEPAPNDGDVAVIEPFLH